MNLAGRCTRGNRKAPGARRGRGGPAPAPIARIRGRFRFRVMLRSADRQELRAAITAIFARGRRRVLINRCPDRRGPRAALVTRDHLFPIRSSRVTSRVTKVPSVAPVATRVFLRRVFRFVRRAPPMSPRSASCSEKMRSTCGPCRRFRIQVKTQRHSRASQRPSRASAASGDKIARTHF